MSIFGLPLILFQVGKEGREWYEDDTISVTKTGVVNFINLVTVGTVEPITIIVTPTGVTDTTSDV